VIFKFLHIATMFTAVAMSIGPAYVLQRVSRNATVPTIRSTFALAAPAFKAIPFLFTGGAVLGIVAALSEGKSLVEPFLLIAYVMFVLATFVGIRFNTPWFQRVVKASAESPDAAQSTELTAALNDPNTRWVDWFDRIIILAFLVDMVFKPFS
jgi:Na+/alanine symporter